MAAAVARNGPTYDSVPNPEGDGPPNNGRRLLDNGLAPIINPVQAAEDEGNADGADALIDGAFSESDSSLCSQPCLAMKCRMTSMTVHSLLTSEIAQASRGDLLILILDCFTCFAYLQVLSSGRCHMLR